MSGKIYLIGGGEIAKGETKEIDNELKKNTKSGSKLVFFGVASNDAPGYIQVIEEAFSDHFEVAIVSKGSEVDFIKNSIKTAAVVYLGGGQTKLLLDFFQDRDLVNILKEAYKNGLIIAGMSAGALALSHFYIDNETSDLKIKKAWGLVDVCTHVHATAKQVEFINQFYQKNKASNQQLISIEEKSAWVVSDDKNSKIGNVWIS